MGFWKKFGNALASLGEDDTSELTKSEHQINLHASVEEAKRNADPEAGKKWLDRTMMRIAWMYAIGDAHFQENDILEIIAMSKEDKTSTRLMFDVLFSEGARFELRYYPSLDSERPDGWLSHDEYNRLSAGKRDKYYPSVFYRQEGSVRYTEYDGREDSRDGDIAIRFAQCFWRIACEFGGYKDISGEKRFTLSPKFSDTSAAACIGVNEQAAFVEVSWNLSAARLDALGEHQIEFMKALDTAIKNLNQCKVAAMRYILGSTSEASEEKAPTYDKCKLDFLTEEVRNSDNEAFVEKYEGKVAALKDKGMGVDAIYDMLVMSEWYSDQVDKAATAYAEYAKKLSEEKKDKDKSKGDKKTAPKYDKQYLPKRNLAEWKRLFAKDDDFMALYNAKLFNELPSCCHVDTLIHHIKDQGKAVPAAVTKQRGLDIDLAVEEAKKAKASESDDDDSGDE